MKKGSIKIITSLLSFVPFFAAITPHFAFAGFLGITGDDLYWISATFTELGVAIAGAFVAITGTLLNATMTATLNMASIVNSTPAIGVAWTTVRNFGSVFIIFLLLYASIQIIIGGGSDIGKLIKNIVIVGLLINFSLFFTKLAVDTSNIISLSFYSAIAPTSLGQTGTSVAPSNSGAGALVGLVSNSYTDGGLSNVFMQSLDLQSFANSASSTVNSTNIQNKYWNITLANMGAIVLMFGAAVSFLAAALAFAVRIGVLILLMAFSPIYFIAMVFPQLQEYSKRWSKMLYSMCLFMPVYLFLMYVAMSVLNDPHFFAFATVSQSTTNVTGGVAGALISANTIGTVLQYIIALLLINAPLAAAISIAGEGSDLVANLMKSVSKWGQGAVTNMRKGIWKNTGGRKFNELAKNEGFKNFASKFAVGDLLHRGVQGIAADYNTTAEKRTKQKDSRRTELGFDETRMKSVQDSIGRLNTRKAREKAAGRNTTITDAALKNLRQQALDIETARAKNFAARTAAKDPSFAGLGGLYNRLTRSNPAASAKASIFVHEKEMKRVKEQLDEHKKDLKEIERDIKNSGVTANGQAATPQNPVIGNAAQIAERKRILNEIAKATKTVEQHESAIRNLK